MQMLYHRPSDAEAIIGARAAANFVQYDEAVSRSVIENVSRLVHLYHEGRVSAGEIVARPDARENSVDQSDLCGSSGSPASDLGEEINESHLPNKGAFPRHVRPCDQMYLTFGCAEL